MELKRKFNCKQTFGHTSSECHSFGTRSHRFQFAYLPYCVLADCQTYCILEARKKWMRKYLGERNAGSNTITSDGYIFQNKNVIGVHSECLVFICSKDDRKKFVQKNCSTKNLFRKKFVRQKICSTKNLFKKIFLRKKILCGKKFFLQK